MNHETVFAAFRSASGNDAEAAAYAPGRVNLIGEHTDYNDGFVLPAAVDRGVALAARRVAGDTFRLHAVDLGQSCDFARAGLERDPERPWADYFKGVVWALSRRGIDVPTCEACVSGDIPQGAGLSSSAAYEVATTLLLGALGGFELSSLETAKLAREAENGFVGVACGIMDPMASVFGQQGRALWLDCRSLARQTVKLPPGLKIVVVNSGVRHSLASSEYNQRRAECDEGVRTLASSVPEVRALRDVTPEQLEPCSAALGVTVGKRCRHVVSENARVEQTVSAMRSGDVTQLKSLMAESHRSLRDDYEVSCLELDVLVELALALPFCHGARLTGAGFGGSTVNLVEVEAVEAFSRSITDGYSERCHRAAEIHVFEPSAGARVLTDGLPA
ncbi:MAG: galactokinase [Polyangiaceae bacterium]|nr:galactokinase [Polyangiaceae bacterium]